MLQQFSIVISHCSDCVGLSVSGVTFLLTMMRFLMRGLLLRRQSIALKITMMIIMTNMQHSSMIKAVSWKCAEIWEVSAEAESGDTSVLKSADARL